MNTRPAAGVNDGIFERLLDIWLPDGGLMAALVEFYADESYCEERSSLLCVAGYLFEKDQAIRFKKRWQAMLDRYCLVEFHMTDCAHHQGEFEKLCRQQCDDSAREAIEIILETASYGFVVSVDEGDYGVLIQPWSKVLLSAYSFCLIGCLAGVSEWADKNYFQGDIAYTFESGYKHEGEAAAAFADIRKNPDLVRRYRLLASAFGPKKKILPLQAADILAWHWLLDSSRRRQGEKRSHPVRQDFLALIRDQDMAMDWSRDHLLQYRELTASLAHSDEGPSS